MLFILLLTLTASLAAARDLNFVESLGRSITKEVSAVKQPIEVAIATVGSSQCENVKRLVGVTYNQLNQSDHEPDVSTLSLVYRDETIQVVFNISTAATTLLNSRDYHRQKKLIIFVHGFTANPYQDSFTALSNALLSRGETNVLALDASSLIQNLYLRSSSYVQYIGQKLGEVLTALVNDGVDPSQIHIIGHSLGAHIAGFTGKSFTDLTGSQIGRISGLDPAGPCFTNVDPELRLKETDAAFVDVMHTDAGVYGLKDQTGHVDFYPNKGSEQPNCLSQSCSHGRTWNYYAESVTNATGFPAVKCASWGQFKKLNCTYDDVVYMGYPTSPEARGRYYLQTSADPPYALGEEGVRFEDNRAVITKIGDSAKNAITNIFG